MREYDGYDDDSIRLYTPVLQRVIILAAVVIAVPVLMWTITTFVRSYVARPKVPLVEHVASTIAPTRIPLLAAPPSPASVAADQSAPLPGDGAAASEAPNPTAETNKGPLTVASLPDSNPSASAASGPSTPSAQAAPMQASSLAIPAPTTAGDAATGGNPTAAASASLPKLPQAPRVTGSAASGGPSSSDRGIAWPNPNATNAPDFAAPRLAPPPPPPPATQTAEAEAEALPTAEPLRGPVPLPRHRPSIFAMAGPMAGTMAASMPARGPVPLPRTRPGNAPATDTIVEMNSSGRSELESAH
jgi:hypothetical protein